MAVILVTMACGGHRTASPPPIPAKSALHVGCVHERHSLTKLKPKRRAQLFSTLLSHSRFAVPVLVVWRDIFVTGEYTSASAGTPQLNGRHHW